ncbi:MAG: Gfo/Idh/MocA family oxidoreductase [Bacteroidales bacterium]|nr:Gfo/Idh/MocA family oxidoreductase [Bacteroidales bacterium]
MTKTNNKTTRRTFIAQTGMISAGITLGVNPVSAKSYKTIIGSNDRIRVGFIGVGNRGTQLLHIFMNQPDCEIAALCDVYEPYITRDRSKVNPRYVKDRPGQIPAMAETFPNKVERYSDYRKLLENKNIDAVCIATPDHWHALMTVDAIKAGKDVYIEKPLSKTIHEGRVMVETQKNSKQIVTVGLNRRAASSFQKLAIDIPAGKIGKVTFASTCYVGNMFPFGIGKMKPENPPADFNWDAWLGPRAYRPYQYNIAPYMFRWWNDYSSQIANNGVHYLDLMRWMMNEQAPVSICASGGKYAVDDDRTIPDTLQVTYEFGSGALFTINVLEASYGSFVSDGFIELRGTKGTLCTNENSYKIVPTRPGQFQSWDKLMDGEENNPAIKDNLLPDGSSRDSTTNMIRNFLDCIKSRKTPYCTLEDGHRSTSLAHLANIALATKQRLQWDPAKERFTNSEEANKLLHYEYRKPWNL